MSDLMNLHLGQSPLLISMPHCGTWLPDEILRHLNPPARSLPDTDWHIPQLYDFAEDLDATILSANYSRYVVDLNRPPDNLSLYPGQAGTGLCPELQFNGMSLYTADYVLDEAEVERRVKHFWQPYHSLLEAEIKRIHAQHGYVLLYDAHSIASQVPRLFEGRLADLNFGTANGESCAPDTESALVASLQQPDYSVAINQRFVGGYITRHYGHPEAGIHAVQMELSQRNYMNETPDFCYREDLAQVLKKTLRNVLETFLTAGAKH